MWFSFENNLSHNNYDSETQFGVVGLTSNETITNLGGLGVVNQNPLNFLGPLGPQDLGWYWNFPLMRDW